MPTPETSKAAAQLVSIRWNRLTPEQRREQMKPALEARKRKAAERQVARDGGAETNE